MIAGGLKAPVEADLRNDIWIKLMGNVAFNPLSALTRATMVEICQNPHTRQIVTQLMEETLDIAARVGSTPDISIEKRLRGAENVGHHKTSMLQDLEAGKQLELDAIVTAVVEMADLTGAAAQRFAPSMPPPTSSRAPACLGRGRPPPPRRGKLSPLCAEREHREPTRQDRLHAGTCHRHRAATWRNSSTPEWMWHGSTSATAHTPSIRPSMTRCVRSPPNAVVRSACWRDLQGPKIRLGRFAAGPVVWAAGEHIAITTAACAGRS